MFAGWVERKLPAWLAMPQWTLPETASIDLSSRRSLRRITKFR